MTRDRIYEYFIEKDNNCAEAMLRALNDEYCLGIPEDSVKLVGGFGGGMGCGKAVSYTHLDVYKRQVLACP